MGGSRKDTRSGQVVRLAPPGHQAPGFTARDRLDLERWGRAPHRVAFDQCDEGPFALLYVDGACWASWGAMRQGRTVLVWDTVSLADIGRFPSMAAALAALPAAAAVPALPNVLPFQPGARPTRPRA